MTGEHVLTIWVVYFNPRDHPGKWVLRGQDVIRGGGIRPQPAIFIEDSLEAVRTHLPPGLVMLMRDPSDDPVIHETWV
jgi:hypothetical protein